MHAFVLVLNIFFGETKMVFIDVFLSSLRMAGERNPARLHLLHKHSAVRNIRPEDAERRHLHVADGGARGTGRSPVRPAQKGRGSTRVQLKL